MNELESILSRFVGNTDLHESCMAILDYFKIRYAQISPAQLPIDAFLKPEFIDSHKDLVNKVTEVAVVGIASKDTFASKKKAELSVEQNDAQLADEKYQEMAFFSIDTKAPMTRTEIALLTRAFNRRMLWRPVVLFVRNGSLLSLSTCERTTYIRTGFEGEKAGKVTILRNINCANPHRGHIDILNSLDITKCKSFDAVYEKWLETFSNELLTKKFYQELSDWYAWAIKEVRYPNDIHDDNDNEKYNHENTIRLVTRLIFVWFLKEKHLIPEEFFDEKYIRENLIKDFDPHKVVDLFYKSTESKYYKAILQNLFFAMLNCPIVDEETGLPTYRRFRDDREDYNNNKLMRYERYFINPLLFVELANQKVPFLNGGLFDCLDDKPKGMYFDAFTDREDIGSQLIVPDYLFFGNEAGKNIDLSDYYGDANKKKVSAQGLIDILKHYCFTIEENTPYEQEVSLDPELLGKVFENLLASYNPETKTTARKSTGSFYTPREIVQYMVDESLVEHLKRTVGAEHESLYRDLLDYASNEVELSDTLRDSIMHSIYNCKVLDPACGSGAFPVGVLQQMVHILSRIDPSNEKWKDLIIEEATNYSKKAFQKEDKAEREELLKEIENTFNEQLNYPDYARKLYIIENCIYGGDIQPIAIQISKLRFFISLVVDQKETNDPQKNFGIRPLPNLEAKFVAANSLVPLEKSDDLFSMNVSVKDLENKLHDANHHIFTAKNPRQKAYWRKKLSDTRQALADLLVENGYISQNAGQQIAGWNMFDQNSFAPFFDPEWMFDIKDGFDIVIGNPPYVQLQNNKGELAKLYEKYNFETFARSADMYCLFYEKGYELLKASGVLCYITSNKWMRAAYGENLRKFLTGKTNPVLLIDFGETHVFESATVMTNILIFKKEKNTYQLSATQVKDDFTDPNNIGKYIEEKHIFCKYVGDESWVIMPDDIRAIKHKIEKQGKQLNEWPLEINYGIKTGCNPAFFITSEERKQILSACRTDDELKATRSIIRPLLRGRDIRPYGHNWDNTQLWLIGTFPSLNLNIDHLPALKSHFLKFGKERLEQTGKTYKINGEEIKSRKKTSGNWFETQDYIKYWENFVGAKILYPNMTKYAPFYYDEDGFFSNDKSFIINGKHLSYLIAFLNSSLFKFCFFDNFPVLFGGSRELRKVFFDKIPVKEVDDATDDVFRDLVSDIQNEYTEDKAKVIDQKIFDLYGLSQEERDKIGYIDFHATNEVDDDSVDDEV